MGNGTKLVSTAPSDREIFLGALERTAPAERAAYLDTACAGDTARRQRPMSQRGQIRTVDNHRSQWPAMSTVRI